MLVARVNINKGEFFSEKNITTKRPGTISPFKIKKFLGKKSSKSLRKINLLNKLEKILFVSSSRADYGLLRNVILETKKIKKLKFLYL